MDLTNVLNNGAVCVYSQLRLLSKRCELPRVIIGQKTKGKTKNPKPKEDHSVDETYATKRKTDETYATKTKTDETYATKTKTDETYATKTKTDETYATKTKTDRTYATKTKTD